MAEDLGLSPVWEFVAFSVAMVVSAMVGPWAGARIDGFGGRGVLMLSNLDFATGLGLLAMPKPAIYGKTLSNQVTPIIRNTLK